MSWVMDLTVDPKGVRAWDEPGDGSSSGS